MKKSDHDKSRGIGQNSRKKIQLQSPFDLGKDLFGVDDEGPDNLSVTYIERMFNKLKRKDKK